MAFVKTNRSVEDLKAKLREDNGSSGSNFVPDKRFLNYYDLDFGDSMKVVLIPDPEGNYYHKWTRHGTYSQEIDSFPCRYQNQNKASCPICLGAYEFYQQGKLDKNGNPLSQHFSKKTYVLAQCVVIDSSIEIQDHGEDTLVHLIWLPIKVFDKLHESVDEGIIQNDIQEHMLVLKKTKSSNGNPGYEHSYFRESIYEPSDDMMQAINAGLIQPWTLSEVESPKGERYVPEPVTEEQAQEWFDKCVNKLTGAGDSMTVSGDTVQRQVQESSAPTASQSTEPPQEVSESAQTTESDSAGDSKDDFRARLREKMKKGQ